jgi:hypothetical protein
MSTVVQSGSQTCTVGTEHTVTTTINTAGTYQALFDLSNGVNGDRFELRVKRKVRAADSVVECYYACVEHVQTQKGKISIPIAIPTNGALDMSVKQVAGTGRAVPWSIESF